LRPGLYAELTLRAKRIHWKGKPDLLGVEDERCEIVEFKTGERRDEHAFQALVYAALWWQDRELNPNGTQAIKLTVAYPDGNLDVPPPNEERLKALTQELCDRTAIALEDAQTQPPPARPSSESCKFCGVKQLCQEYWTPDVQRGIQPNAGGVGYADVQAIVKSRHGATSWDATIEVAGKISSGTPVLIRTPTDEAEFQVGSRIRLVDVWFGAEPEGVEPVKVVTMGMQSEGYVLE